ncbi:MAG: REP-associated tyrosine transposase [Candidatus Acidiferrales bacterium]
MTRLNPFTRKNIRLAPGNYIGKRTYFVTICCHGRRPAFQNAETISRHTEILRDCANQMGFAIHAYCFMPDHLHLLVEGLTSGSRLLEFVNLFKQRTAFEYRRNEGASLWQFKFYDHILRRNAAFHDVAWYIWMNPVRKGLARKACDFPFSGSFSMPWRAQRPPREPWTPPWRKRAARAPAANRPEMPGWKPGATHA